MSDLESRSNKLLDELELQTTVVLTRISEIVDYKREEYPIRPEGFAEFITLLDNVERRLNQVVHLLTSAEVKHYKLECDKTSFIADKIFVKRAIQILKDDLNITVMPIDRDRLVDSLTQLERFC